MGILSSGCRAKLFLSLWWSLRSWLLSFPPNACRGPAVQGLGGAEPPKERFWLFLLERFLFVFRERFVSPRAICYPQAHPQGIGACIMTYSGREEERAPSIYRSSSLLEYSEALARVRRSKGFPTWARKFFFSVKVPPSMSVFQLSRTFETSPSSWACTRPVAIRQRSTAS
jgi:hypothetical protein